MPEDNSEVIKKLHAQPRSPCSVTALATHRQPPSAEEHRHRMFESGLSAWALGKMKALGAVLCSFASFVSMAMAAAARGEELPAALIAALDALHAIAADMALQDSFRLNAGDISLWHNWSWLHGRTAFADGAGEARLLLRLWLRSDLAAPLDIRFAQRGEAMDRDHDQTMRQGMLKV